MKSYTDLDQSRKLAEILPIESADMVYVHTVDLEGDEHYDIDFRSNQPLFEDDIPCWSLDALLSVLPFPVLYMEMIGGMILWSCECHFMNTDEMVKIEHCDNPIDSCYKIILKLYEQKLL